MKLLHRKKPVTYVRVYTGEGKKAHLATAPVTTVLCGWKPSKGGWRGTGSDAERQVAAVLPACNMCTAVLENTQGGD